MMLRFDKALPGLAALTLLALVPAARGDLIYQLNVDGCSGNCGPQASFGSIDLHQVSSTEVLVTETLNNGNKFVSTGAGDALEFNIAGNPAVTLSNISAGFSTGPAPDYVSTFGTFEYSVTCSVCGSGASSPQPGPLKFDVQLTEGGNLSINNFVAGGATGLDFFTTDILSGTTGNTGNVAAFPPEALPEPVSFSLFGAGLLSLGLFRRVRSA